MMGIMFMIGGTVLLLITVIVAIVLGVSDSNAKKEMRRYIDEQY